MFEIVAAQAAAAAVNRIQGSHDRPALPGREDDGTQAILEKLPPAEAAAALHQARTDELAILEAQNERLRQRGRNRVRVIGASVLTVAGLTFGAVKLIDHWTGRAGHALQQTATDAHQLLSDMAPKTQVGVINQATINSLTFPNQNPLVHAQGTDTTTINTVKHVLGWQVPGSGKDTTATVNATIDVTAPGNGVKLIATLDKHGQPQFEADVYVDRLATIVEQDTFAADPNGNSNTESTNGTRKGILSDGLLGVKGIGDVPRQAYVEKLATANFGSECLPVVESSLPGSVQQLVRRQLKSTVENSTALSNQKNSPITPASLDYLKQAAGWNIDVVFLDPAGAPVAPAAVKVRLPYRVPTRQDIAGALGASPDDVQIPPTANSCNVAAGVYADATRPEGN